MCFLGYTSGMGPGARGGAYANSPREAADWPARAGAGRAEGPGLAGEAAGEAGARCPPGPPTARRRGLSQTMSPLWALLALGCLRLCSGKRMMRGGIFAQGGRAVVSCILTLPRSPDKSLDGKGR